MTTRVYPRRWTANERISALKLNQTVDAVRDLYARSGLVEQQFAAAREPDALFVRFNSFPPFSGGFPRPYVICLDQAGKQINVAKPPLLQGEATHAGFTFSYTSDTEREANPGAEDQVIIPAYDSGAPDRLVVVPCATGLVDANNVPIDWIDVNASGRMWAKVVTP